MKNQNSIIPSIPANAEFIDLPSKNPVYQPLAGKQAKTSDSKNAPAAPFIEKSHSGIEAGPGQRQKPDHDSASGAANLERTLKLVEDLHRRMVQRGRLVHTIDNLDKFEIEQKQEAEDTISNYYQGCEIEITDDKRNKFSTKNPVIIKAVAAFVRDLCMTRLAEIEAEIVLPE